MKHTYLLALVALLMVGGIVTHAQTPPPQTIQPDDFTYLGAFRLPTGEMRPNTFEYGGNAMTFYPDGDPNGAADGFGGSLFITGHERMPYGELPDGSRLAEVSIPAPQILADVHSLPQATYLQPLTDVAAGAFVGLDEIPRIGLAYLDTPATGPLLHLTWGVHFQPEPPVPSHAWLNLDLANANLTGYWFVSPENPYSTQGYLLDIPTDWADEYLGGRYLATGRYRDGGWSGMGPALFAYCPWQDDGRAAPDGTTLDAIPLLMYARSDQQPNIVNALNGYQHPDEWEGAAWLTTRDGRAALAFVGTKAVGAKYWYGFPNVLGPDVPCVETEMIGVFTLCRLADGSECPPEDLLECQHPDYRGWWSAAFEAQMILYDPADLARVALGEWSPDQPQPYAVINLEAVLYHNPDNADGDALGVGVQRRMRIGAAAYDRAGQRLYVLELFADGAAPVVHVWAVE